MIEFEDFYNLYGRKVGGKKARIAWNKLSPTQHQAIMDHLPERLATDKQWCEWGSKPHPATFLNGERWKDDYEKCGRNSNQGSFEQLQSLS